MTVSTADRQLPLRDLVDREFQPGELPVAEPTSAAVEEPPGRGDGEGRPALAAWLAMGSAAAIFVLIVASAAVSLAESAIREGSILDGLYLAALIVLVGSLVVLVARQARALRKLKSAERAREMAAGLAKLDGAGSGTRLLGALRAVYSDKPLILGHLRCGGRRTAAASFRPRRHRAARSRDLPADGPRSRPAHPEGGGARRFRRVVRVRIPHSTPSWCWC